MTQLRSINQKPDYFGTSEPEVIIGSPGRINLIGEHTDYNQGFVLPTAIDKYIRLEFRKNQTENFCRVYSMNLEQGFEFQLEKGFSAATGWQKYIVGVIDQMQKRNLPIQGFDCYLRSNLPLGAGMSSSAALECGLATGLNQLFELGLRDLEIVKLSQQAENEFVGSNCGIMDQYSSVMSRKGHLILLDCKKLEAEYIPVDFGNYSLLLLNTNVSHNLAESDYNSRRNQCEKAVKIIADELPYVKSLRDVDIDTLKEFREALGDVIFRRCKYVLKENQRVLKAAKFLKQSKFEKFGKLMYQSHKGLQYEYEVSCPELDFLVEHTRQNDYILGARMMGGGFGGCTLNLIRNDKMDQYVTEVSQAYHEKFGLQLDSIKVSPAAGTQITKTIL